MSISGKQPINVGLPNESVGSDSLYVAFNKVNTNFNTLFACASPYNTFTAGDGISANANSSTGVLTITNTGVTSLSAGTGITLSGSNGNITISANTGGNGGGGTITSIGLLSNSSRITVSSTTSNPIVSTGNFTVDLATSGVSPGSYTNPTLTVDSYGRITSAANNAVSGTVTSVGLVAVGSGLTISGSPVTSNGTITIENTGVTRLVAGSGITISGGTGNVTVSAATSGGTVTSVGISSSQLVVSGSPVVNSGTISVNLPNSVTFSGNVNAGNLVLPTGNIIYTPRYGAFYSNATQTNPVANTAMPMTFNNSVSANGVSVVSNSRLTVAKTGIYNIQFSAQLTKTDAGTDYIEIWLSKNGNTVPWTNTRFRLEGGNTQQLASLNFIESLNSGEYVQLMWGSADTAAQIIAIPAANTTMNVAVPSVIVTVTPVGA